MTKNLEKEPLILLQVEYTSSRAKKRPFTKGDACLFKTVALLLTERLQKFAILSTATKGNDGVDRTVQFIEKIAKFESKKRLCRELEREMMDTMDTETEKYRGFIQTYSKLLHPNHYQVLTLTTYSHSNKKNTLCISLQIV